jgi:hypothetical protein
MKHVGKEHPTHLRQPTQTNNFCFTREQNWNFEPNDSVVEYKTKSMEVRCQTSLLVPCRQKGGDIVQETLFISPVHIILNSRESKTLIEHNDALMHHLSCITNL